MLAVKMSLQSRFGAPPLRISLVTKLSHKLSLHSTAASALSTLAHAPATLSPKSPTTGGVTSEGWM